MTKEFTKALEDLERDCRFIDQIGEFSSLHRNDFMGNKSRESIRRALSIAEKIEAGSHVLVPREPNTKILKAMFECRDDAPWSELYKAMIQAGQE